MSSKDVRQLTPEQEAMLPKIRDEWIGHGLSTERIDIGASLRGFELAYQAAKLDVPTVVLVVGSPLAGLVCAMAAEQGSLDYVLSGSRDLVCSGHPAGVWRQDGGGAWRQDGTIIVGLQDGEKLRWVAPCTTGSHGKGWFAYYDAFARLGFDDLVKSLRGLTTLAKNCGWLWTFDKLAIVTDRPSSLVLDDDNRPHCLDGPAISYLDGFNVFAVHGIAVSEHVIMRPETITVGQVRGEDNAEIRRVMVDRMGPAKYRVESRSVLVHHDLDELGFVRRLWRTPLLDDEDVVTVEVTNATCDSCGVVGSCGCEHPVHKVYELRVPPGVQRCREALAFTAGVAESEYVLSVQS